MQQQNQSESNYQKLHESKQVERSALEELDAMIGLEDIKQRVHHMYRFLKYQQKRSEDGYRSSDQPSLHMIFMGNPGTGKTTLARLMAKIYHELGLLERPEVVETDRSSLVGAFVGPHVTETRPVSPAPPGR